MADALTPLQRIQGLFGIKPTGTGVSTNSARAIDAADEELANPGLAPVSGFPAAPAVGAQPSTDLLGRVKANQEAASADSLARILARRRAAAGGVLPQ